MLKFSKEKILFKKDKTVKENTESSGTFIFQNELIFWYTCVEVAKAYGIVMSTYMTMVLLIIKMSYSIELNKTGLGMDEHLMEDQCQIVIDTGFLAMRGLAYAEASLLWPLWNFDSLLS